MAETRTYERRPHLPKVAAMALLALSLSAASESATPTNDAAPPPESAAESELVPDPEKQLQTSPGPRNPPAAALFEKLRVISSPIAEVPGSATYLDAEALRQQDYTDVHRVLRRVPGVNVQEEDGYGLRPNIGMRGTGVERSQKITVMEDGVLIAPAPYSAPSAYYFPTVARMEGIEVRKGSSSVQQGPFTNGGALNLISSSIPSALEGEINLAAGGDDTLRGRGRVGDSYDRFGWMVEAFRQRTDGFKQLDGGGTTGFELEDYLGKFRVNSGPGARLFQALEVKLGRTENTGHETYLGLTDEDFALTPYRRYAASQEDRIVTDHEQVQLRYFIRPSARYDLTATIYRNDFRRNWRKLEGVAGLGLGTVVGDPQLYSAELAILRGDSDSDADQLAVRNNRRSYYSQGVQAVVGLHPAGRWANHDFDFSLRLHEDEEDRFQENDLFRMTDGLMELTTAGAPGSHSNRINSARALAFSVQDRISLGRWTVTPGLRLETIDLSRLDYGTANPERDPAGSTRRERDVDVLVPGVGVTYRLDDRSSLLAGVHRGFAPPAPGSNDDADPEESVNYEVGYRFAGRDWSSELVGFFNDYDNLLGNDTISSGGTGEGDQFNGGKAAVHGLEATWAGDPGRALNLRVGLPMSLTYTYTRAEFRSSFDSEFAGWGSEVVTGDELPYLPRHQASLSAGVVGARWSGHLGASFTDGMRTRAGQGPVPVEESTDAYVLVDLKVSYDVRSGLELYTQVRNLTDEVYIAARRPAGARPGIGRTALAGISWNF